MYTRELMAVGWMYFVLVDNEFYSACASARMNIIAEIYIRKLCFKQNGD